MHILLSLKRCLYPFIGTACFLNLVIHPPMMAQELPASIEEGTQVSEVLSESTYESDQQAYYEHWSLNRQILLLGVPVVAGAVAVALASSSKHDVSYYTGYAYYSEFDDYSYDRSFDSGYGSGYGSFDSSSHNDSNHDHHVQITPTLEIGEITGTITFTNTLTGSSGAILEQTETTVTTPGVYSFETFHSHHHSSSYDLLLSYSLDAVSSVTGTLKTTCHDEGDKMVEISHFTAGPNQSGMVEQHFGLSN